jgi:hypothetical protein
MILLPLIGNAILILPIGIFWVSSLDVFSRFRVNAPMPFVSRRKFLDRSLKGGLAAGVTGDLWNARLHAEPAAKDVSADIAIIGGSLGGCAAALAALRMGHRVVMTEETDWIGGQLTSQGVPPDEHRWIESFGANASYRELRRRIRDYYRQHYPLTHAQRTKWDLNPGAGSVSRLCHEPRVALAVLRDWLAPYLSSGQLILWTQHRPVGAELDGDEVSSVEMESIRSGQHRNIRAKVFLDATELGDLLPLAKTEYVTGAESRQQTGELHASAMAGPDNEQAFTMCFAMDYLEGEDHTIERPDQYDFWRDYVPSIHPAWPGKWLDWTYTHPRSLEPRRLGFNPANGPFKGVINLWSYRRIAARSNFEPGTYRSDISLVNWPQNDYLLGSIVDVTQETLDRHVRSAKQLSLSMLYWMQTEAPRHDDGQGYPGLRLRPDVMGTEDGLAKYPYVRESRRIQAEYTVTEKDCGLEQRMQITGADRHSVRAAEYEDSVGLGSYAIDLHPSTGGDNYIDFESLPFQIPLGALIPQRVRNLIPACKNIGSTHVTNGCYRLHPVEWGIGEAAGILAAQMKQTGEPSQAIRNQPRLFAAYRSRLIQQGVELKWPF